MSDSAASPIRRILVPLDQSTEAEWVLPLASALASALGARLRVASVFLPVALEIIAPSASADVEAAMTELRQQLRDYLRDVGDRLATQCTSPVEDELIRGRSLRTTFGEAAAIAGALARSAQGRGVDLILMTTHGRGGASRVWLGSVADALLRQTRVPLLLVRPSRDPGRGPFRRILVALDGSPRAEAVLPGALALAARPAGRVTLLRVVPPRAGLATSAAEDLDRIAAALVDAGVAVTPRIVEDDHPAHAILRTGEELDADLLALATHGRGGVSRMVLGSVTDKVVRGTDRPVLVVRPEVASSD